MSTPFVYAGLELKRAFRRIPQMLLGAAALFILMGAAALLAGRALYGESALGRIQVGVVLEEDRLAKQAMSMISSLESVKSICDFSYIEEEEGEKRLKAGELDALMKLPEGFIEDIISGANTPVTIVFPMDAGPESRVFKELTDAGAGTLSAAQAGIYAGDELLAFYGMADSVSVLERDLNRLFLEYSLPRMDYFKKAKVSATGDVDVITFYGISGFVLCLLFGSIPASGYLAPKSRIMKQKLTLGGMGPFVRALSAVLGLSFLLLAIAAPAAALAVKLDVAAFSLKTAGSLLLVLLSASAFCVCMFRLSGSLLSGVMALFFVTVMNHFLAGGFLPDVFLPEGIRNMKTVLPSGILMDGVKMIITESWSLSVFLRLSMLFGVCFLICFWKEAEQR